ncbi:MAG: hypothetical protein WB526_09645, partial [Candidatus Cybelea sp.]
MRVKKILSAVVTAAVFLAPSVARAYTNTVPTLVYSFTYSAKQDINAKDSANPAEDYGNAGGFAAPGSGTSHYSGSLTDKGTMTVGILAKQSDGGLIVSISEAGEQTR